MSRAMRRARWTRTGGGINWAVLGRWWCRGQAEQVADRVDLVLRLRTLGGAAMGVNGVVLIRELARMDFLTIRGQAGCFTGLSIAVDSQTLTLP